MVRVHVVDGRHADAQEQTWSGAAAWFLDMWVVMMVAMMLPSLVRCSCVRQVQQKGILVELGKR